MEVLCTVIVPIYKVEAYLKKCVDSILGQSFSNFELILVDDGSPDACPDICDAYEKQDSRVKVIHKKNGGLVSARNAGILAAAGEYVCYVDGDDWIDVGLLQKVMEQAIHPYHPDMVVYGMVKQFDGYQESIAFYPQEGILRKDRMEREIYPYMMWDKRKIFYTGMIFPTACGKIIRRELLLAHYCKDERIRMGEDNAFIFECLYNARSVYFLPEKFYFYNQLNQGSLVHSYDPDRFFNNRILVDYLDGKLGGKETYLDDQLNAFKAYWLIMAVFHEVKCGRPLMKSSKHIKENIREFKILEGIKTNELPIGAKLYMLLLKAHCYIGALLAAKAIEFIRKSNYRGGMIVFIAMALPAVIMMMLWISST